MILLCHPVIICYNSKIHKVISVDIQKMYSSINVIRCISIILEKVYSDPKKYFQFKDRHGNLLPPPKRENFKTFLIQILTKYSIVRSQIGIFQQKSGLSMGSSLSPILSNIFVNNLESKIVQKYIDTGKVKFYSRFADDSLIIIHKNSIRSLLREINNFDKSLNFTVDYIWMKIIQFNFLTLIFFLIKTKKLNSKNIVKIQSIQSYVILNNLYQALNIKKVQF